MRKSSHSSGGDSAGSDDEEMGVGGEKATGNGEVRRLDKDSFIVGGESLDSLYKARLSAQAKETLR